MKKLNLILVLLFVINAVHAQDDKNIFYEIIEEDRVSVEALALYPEETRNAILIASLHPEIIMRLENIQGQVRQKFLQLIETRPQEEQRDIYELSRYDGLLEQIASDKKRKPEQRIREILKDYPQEIHETTLRLSSRNHDLLYAVNVLNQSANSSFENILTNYNEEVRRSYRHLIQLPEVIEILADNMRLTVAVGDLYRREPEWVRSRLDSLNLEAARANAREAEEWKQRLEDDSELLEDFQNSAENYARERGYSEEEIRQERQIISHVTYHHFYSYPYWFGFPYWYPTSFWHRWPLRYDWGFFYGPGNVMFLTGMPSFYFTYWHFAVPLNHYYYPHLSSVFVQHFRQHPRSTTGVSAGVSTWLSDNRENVPRNLLAEDGQQVQRMREYGLFESEYRERLAERPEQPVSREAFLQANNRRFESLAEPGLRDMEVRRGDVRPERAPRGIEGEAVRPGTRFDDGMQRDPRFDDPASPEMRTPPERRERVPIPDRQRPLERTPAPPVRRNDPSIQRQPTPTPTPAPAPTPQPSPAPRQAPPAGRATPPSGGAPRQAPAQARPMKIIIEGPDNGQSFDMARRHHLFNWKK
jgi:hypothetical protein